MLAGPVFIPDLDRDGNTNEGPMRKVILHIAIANIFLDHCIASDIPGLCAKLAAAAELHDFGRHPVYL